MPLLSLFTIDEMHSDGNTTVTKSQRFMRAGHANRSSQHRPCGRGGRTLLQTLTLVTTWTAMIGFWTKVEAFAPADVTSSGYREITRATSMERTSCLAQNHDRWRSHQPIGFPDVSMHRLSAASILTDSDTIDERTRSRTRRRSTRRALNTSDHKHCWTHVLPLAVPLTSYHWRKRTKLQKHKQWQRHDAFLSSVLPEEAHPPTLAWAQRYTSLHRLRAAFGGNRNKLWGDLDAATTRRLYKTLLPTALLGLVQAGVHEPSELAPLAYRARVAAKLYARERSTVPVRILANIIDGWRQFTRTGRFRCRGMTYEQIWDKYRRAVLEVDSSEDCLDDERDLATRVCLKILERSCVSNRKVDQWVLPNTEVTPISSLSSNGCLCASPDLARITAALEDDVREILSNAAQP